MNFYGSKYHKIYNSRSFGRGLIYSGSNSAQPPDAPVAASASQIDYFDFIANWAASAGATGYYLDVATDSGFTSYVTGFENLDVGNNTAKFVDTLDSNTTYYYRVRAYNANGTSANSNTISTATLAFLMDDYTAYSGEFDFRIIRGSYYKSGGALVTLRRSSDDAEATFIPTRDDGYVLTMNSQTSGGTTLATWIGSESAYLAAYYNQNGTSNHWTQSTTTQQLQIISAGSFITQGGKIAAKFERSNLTFMDNPANLLSISSNDAFCLTVCSYTTQADFLYILSVGDVVSPYSSGFILGRTNTGIVWINGFDVGTSGLSGGFIYYFTWENASGSVEVFSNGASSGTDTGLTTISETTTTKLGTRGDETTSFANCYIQAIITDNSDRTTEAAALNTAVNDYYAKY